MCDWISNNSSNIQAATNCRSTWISHDIRTSSIPCLNRELITRVVSRQKGNRLAGNLEFEEADESILRSSSNPGKDEKPDEEILHGIEQFVYQLYQQKATITTAKEPRLSSLQMERCLTNRCQYRKARLLCTDLCSCCGDEDDDCENPKELM